MSSQPISPELPEWMKSGVESFCQKIDNLATPYPFRHPDELDDYICLHQNDYLRLSARPEVLQAKKDAIREEGNLFLSSTIFSGGRGMEEHYAFRALLADAMQAEDAVLTSSGWAANVGLLESVAKPGTPIYLDQKAHVSLWDGARLSPGKPIMVRHNDPEYLERRIKRDGAGIVCIDAFYSISGAVADVAAYVDVCERTGSVLVLDEAHSLVIAGQGGGGLAVEAGVAERVHFRTASFSKAIGGHGGCIAASRHLVWFLTHRAHAIVFSSSALACDSAAHRTALSIARAEPWLGRHTLEMAALLRQELSSRGIDTGASASQIVAIEFNHEQLASSFYQLMRDRGILTAIFLSPATPDGISVARFSTHAHLEAADVVRAADAAAEVMDVLGVARKSKQQAA
jgi:CAI-1 autoinducer synthase